MPGTMSERLAEREQQHTKASVVLELVALAYADGLPHPAEMEVLKSVALGLGISELRLLEMAN